MRNRIAVIIPYFGKWPEWIELYFYSCSKNPMIDWFFFTDCVLPENKYPNIHFQRCTFVEYCDNVSNTLCITFKPSNAYKLCDLRPFLGYIHNDLICNYEFWGYADVDIIWGDISKFYTNDLLDKYDVFSTHNDRLSGHFSIIRNSVRYNQLCFLIPAWKEKLCDAQHHALDEGAFSKLVYPEAAYIGKIYRQVIMKIFDWKTAWEIYYSIFPMLHFFLKLFRRKVFFREQHTTPILNQDGRLYKYESDTWFYEDGVVSNNRVKRQYIYLHFMIFKKNNVKPHYYWMDDYYKIPTNFNFNRKITINKEGIFVY